MTAATLRPTGWLRAVRAAWLVFFALALSAFVVAVPARWNELARPAPRVTAHLAALGWPLIPYAVFTLATETLFTATFLVVALVIFARRASDRMALFTAFMLIAFGIGNQNITPTVGALRGWPVGNALYHFFAFAAWVTFSQFPYLFPSGRHVPRWTRLPALVWFLITIPWNFMVGSRLDPLTWPLAVFGPLIFALYLSFFVAQIYRYRRVSNAVERQQTKWVALALILVVSAIAVEVGVYAWLGPEALTYLSTSAGDPPTTSVFAAVRLARIIFLLIFLLLPAGLAFSILRYRLWDIDVVIRRTLIYSALTAVLALAYWGSVVVFENVFRGLTGGESPVVIVLSTLLSAALFGPARTRVQRAIDRAFYRRKYDATRILAAFGAQARAVTDLPVLTERLQGAVQDTMQPAHVGLWLAGERRA
jgi:hypothetical protein